MHTLQQFFLKWKEGLHDAGAAFHHQNILDPDKCNI